MPKLRFLSLSMLPFAAAACTDDPPDPGAGPASIKVSTVRAPAAIAFRDGLDGEWQIPSPTSTGSYQFEVNGPYIVSVVCSAGDDFLVETRQLARTPDDGRELDLACTELPLSDATVTGRVAQPGNLSLGELFTSSTEPDWELDILMPAGTYDLIATSDERIAIRRDIAVSGTVDLGTIDVAQQGAALVPVALTAPNAAAGEVLEAQVAISTPNTDDGLVHLGSLESARVAPAELLDANVRQSVAIVAWSSDDRARILRRDFRAGDPTAFALPDPVPAMQFDTTSGKVVASWSTLPEHDRIRLRVAGSLPATPPAGGTVARSLELELSQRFLAATGTTRATIDTDVPGHLPGWRPDLAREYAREVLVLRDRDGERAVSSLYTLVNRQAVSQAARPRYLPGKLPGDRLGR